MHPKELEKWFVGEDIILPKPMPLRRETGDAGNFLGRKVSRTLQRTLLKGYGNAALSRGILPTAKLWWIFAEDSRVCKHPLFVLGQNPPEFSPAGENSVPRQGQKPFNLKAKLTYRVNAPLSRTLAERKVFTFSLFESLGQAFLKACGIQRQSLWSPPAGGEISFTAFSFCLAFSFGSFIGKRKSAKRFPMTNDLYYTTTNAAPSGAAFVVIFRIQSFLFFISLSESGY